MANAKLYEVLAKRCQKLNLPGITQAKFIDAGWVQTWPGLQDYAGDPATNKAVTLASDIVLDTTAFPDAAWMTMEFTPEKNGTRVEALGDLGQEYFKTTVEGFVGTSSRETFFAFEKLLCTDVIMAVLDRNEEWRIVGRPLNPAFLRFTHDTSKAEGEAPGFAMTLEWKAHKEVPPFYDGSF